MLTTVISGNSLLLYTVRCTQYDRQSQEQLSFLYHLAYKEINPAQLDANVLAELDN